MQSLKQLQCDIILRCSIPLISARLFAITSWISFQCLEVIGRPDFHYSKDRFYFSQLLLIKTIFLDISFHSKGAVQAWKSGCLIALPVSKATSEASTRQTDTALQLRDCTGGRRRKEGLSDLWHLSSQVTITHDGALLSWRWLNIWLPMGSSEWIPCFALLVRAAFTFHIKLSLSQPMSFHTSALPVLSPIALVGSERAAAWGWDAWCCSTSAEILCPSGAAARGQA